MHSGLLSKRDIAKTIKDIIGNILHISPNSIQDDDSFFYLGGSSILLIELITKIENIYNIKIDIRFFIKDNSISRFTNLIQFYQRHPKFNIKPRYFSHQTKKYNLSFEQKQIWLSHNVAIDKSTYNIPLICEIQNELNESKLHNALKKIITSQQLLNASIFSNNNDTQLQIHKYTPMNYFIKKINDDAVDEAINYAVRHEFNLNEAPLYRITLFKTEIRYILCCIFHHIIVDSKSLIIFCKLLSDYYNNQENEKNFLKYSQYIQYQNYLNSSQYSKKQKKYWMACLNDINALIRLPEQSGSVRITDNTKIICAIDFDLNQSFIDKSNLFSKNNGITLYTLFISTFNLIISRLINQKTFYITTPITTRVNSDFSNMFGLFINLLPYKCNIDDDINFFDYLKDTEKKLRKLYYNSYVSHEKIQSYSCFNKEEFRQLFNIAFTVDEAPSLNFKGISTKKISIPYNNYKFDLTFFIKIQNNSPKVLIEFNPDKFSQTTIQSLFHSFLFVIDYVLSNVNSLLGNIPLIEQQNLKGINNPYLNGDNKTILHLFTNTANKYPLATAIEHCDDSISYSNLESLSSRFANYLLSSDFKPNDKIAIYSSHTIDLIIAILGILKAKCVYVPIHPSTPSERLVYILNNSNSKTILYSKTLPDSLNFTSRISMKDCFSKLSTYSPLYLIDAKQSDIAYIIYTSGSTGLPKGVMVNHANLANLFSQSSKLFDFNSNDCWLLYHSYSFDFSIWEIFGALLHGSKLVIPSKITIQSPDHLYQLIIDKNITILNQTPTAFSIFSQQAIKQRYEKVLPLRYIIFGGEAINNQVILNWFNYFSSQIPYLVNMYGITEGTIHVTYQFLDEYVIRENRIGTPIGKPLYGNSILLLDERKLEVPPGFFGEIYIYGNCVAQGYINNKKFTEDQFLRLTNYTDKSFYKTGDIAIKDNNSLVSYIGRNDSQVKIRGYRIELKEIESILATSEYIDDIAIYVDDENDSQKSLIVFVVPSHTLARPILNLMSLQNSDFTHKTKLPNGLLVSDINPSETLSLYKEIFINQDYLRCKTEISDDSVIFDVGANIGLFSLFVGLMNSKAKIYAYEPFAPLCECINTNKNLYSLNLTINTVGLSNRSGTKRFTYFENVTSMSTLYNYTDEQKYLLKSSLNIDNNHLKNDIVNYKLKSKSIECNVETLSDQIEKHYIKQIDLLKIDSEGSELDILLGIKNNHWNIIQTIVIEVNNVDSRLTPIKELLTIKGYNLHCYKIDSLTETNLFIVFASRKSINQINKLPILQLPMADETDLIRALKNFASMKLPIYMLPSRFEIIAKLPKTTNGKIDFKNLKSYLDSKAKKKQKNIKKWPVNTDINIIRHIWEKLLKHETSELDDNFFEIGGNSILAVQLAAELSAALQKSISVIDIFNYPSIEKLNHYLHNPSQVNTDEITKLSRNTSDNQTVAIIGMAGKFPDADNISYFWQNLLDGKNCLTNFNTSVSLSKYDESFIPIAGVLNNPYIFDAKFFKISPSEAKYIDPQQRMLLEICYACLLNANIETTIKNQNIGVFASIDSSQYKKLIHENNLPWQVKRNLQYGNSRDFIATRIAYKLGLNGPAVTVSTACSSSLTACTQAINSLKNNECEIAIVCAASMVLEEYLPGYYFEPDGIMSNDGKCCPFDENSSGTVPGSAVVAIALKKHEAAIQDGDSIVATIQSYSINNDGNDKVGYIAPSISGQSNCLKNIYQNFNTESLKFIETHGTGTKIGDAVELKALSESITNSNGNITYLGASKANIGHTGAAAGLCGLIKTALVLNQKIIPPQINFKKWNPLCHEFSEKFIINARIVNLSKDVLYAGVSSFGIGGTNVHVLLKSEKTASNFREKHDSTAIFQNTEKYFFESNNQTNNVNIEHKKNKPLENINNNSQTHILISGMQHLEIIKDILNIIAKDLDMDSVNLSDNFFNLDGDSLIALGIITQIHIRYNILISIDDFYKSNNFEELIAILLKKDNRNLPTYNILKKDGQNILVLIHSGSGSSYQYNFFSELYLPNTRIISVENQVLNDINSDINSIEDMAQYYINMLKDHLTNEITLCGWSFGGNVAYEMALQLQKSGIFVNQIIMLDSWAKYPKKYNVFRLFKNIWYKKLDKSYIFEDELWKKMLWMRLKMLINYQPQISNHHIKLYKANAVDLEMVVENNATNFWGEITNTVEVINVNAKHQNIISMMQDNNMFEELFNK